jgi:integrase
MDGYKGGFVVRMALVFSVLTFCRPGPIRKAEWEEISFEEEMWTIPSSKMKLTVEKKLLDIPHLVPLSSQAISVLEKLHHFTGRGRYLFPNQKNRSEPMSDGAVTSALKRMGYAGLMCAHGFRATASTLLNEKGVGRSDAIEAQLAHVGDDKTRAIYNRAEYVAERRKLMQDWSNMLDSLRADAVAKAARHTL